MKDPIEERIREIGESAGFKVEFVHQLMCAKAGATIPVRMLPGSYENLDVVTCPVLLTKGGEETSTAVNLHYKLDKDEVEEQLNRLSDFVKEIS